MSSEKSLLTLFNSQFSPYENDEKEMISLANAGDINGITLTKEDVTLIIQTKKNALAQTGRFEFGKSPYEMLLRAFADSPYITSSDAGTVIAELIQFFYELKNECDDAMTDEELTDKMKNTFNGAAAGSAEMLRDIIETEIRQERQINSAADSFAYAEDEND